VHSDSALVGGAPLVQDSVRSAHLVVGAAVDDCRLASRGVVTQATSPESGLSPAKLRVTSTPKSIDMIAGVS